MFAVTGGARIITVVISVGRISVRILTMGGVSSMLVIRLRRVRMGGAMGICRVSCTLMGGAVLLRTVIRLLSEGQNGAKHAHSNSENTGNQQLS